MVSLCSAHSFFIIKIKKLSFSFSNTGKGNCHMGLFNSIIKKEKEMYNICGYYGRGKIYVNIGF